MVIKIYISGISGNKEVKKRQQRVLLILDSKNITYEIIDIAEPGNEDKKDFMQNNSKSSGATISDPNPRHPLPPQIYNEDDYCGDYDQFDMANEIDEMEKFLKLAPSDSEPNQISNAEIKLGNGEIHNDEPTQNVDTKEESKDAVPDNNETTAESKVENGDENVEKKNEDVEKEIEDVEKKNEDVEKKNEEKQEEEEEEAADE